MTTTPDRPARPDAPRAHRRAAARSRGGSGLTLLSSGGAGIRYRRNQPEIIKRVLLGPTNVISGGAWTFGGWSQAMTAAEFNVLSTHSGHEAARNLLAFLADRMIARASGSVSLIEPLASETTDYNVGTTHPLYELRLRAEAAPISEAHAMSLTAAGLFLTSGSTDYATAEFGTAPIERQRDLTSQTAATTDNTAIAHLRQRKLDEDAGQLAVPPICGLELLDMLDFTDPFINNGAQLRRVMSITWKLDRPRAIYEQQIGLGPP